MLNYHNLNQDGCTMTDSNRHSRAYRRLAAMHRIPVGSRHAATRLRCAARRATVIARRCIARHHLRFGGLDCIRIVRRIAVTDVITHALQLRKFCTDMRTCRVTRRLSERRDWNHKSAGNNGCTDN